MMVQTQEVPGLYVCLSVGVWSIWSPEATCRHEYVGLFHLYSCYRPRTALIEDSVCQRPPLGNLPVRGKGPQSRDTGPKHPPALTRQQSGYLSSGL